RVFENVGSAISPIWQEKPSWNPPSYMGLLSLGDLDGDCDMDILGGGSFQSSAFENTGTITNPVWTERSGWLTPDAHRPFHPELIDIDSDGSSWIEEKYFALHQGFITIYPNPFTQKTVICYTCPFSVSGHEPRTRLTIHDLAGRLVKSFPHTGLETIHDSSTGSDGRFVIHKVTWDGTDDNGKKVKSGIYFCKFQANNYTAIKKLSLIK
ncbi:T9SS type A sorting domain-containing protein, partial [candidate division WOR-3 bacterium]|nr:T9SS type A sorting domain-containing protein [candidate division WOR-3 bacterium]